MPTAALALTLALVGAGHAQSPDRAAATITGGDPVDASNAADVAAMIRVADTIVVDFVSLVGGEPATIPADALIAGWSGNLTAEKASFHQRTNHLVSFEGEGDASMTSHGYAWNRMERGGTEANGSDPMQEVWGVYAHGFVRTDAVWKVDAMTLEVTAERCNPFVRDTPGS